MKEQTAMQALVEYLEVCQKEEFNSNVQYALEKARGLLVREEAQIMDGYIQGLEDASFTDNPIDESDINSAQQYYDNKYKN